MIEIKNISYKYDEKYILRNISLKIYEGDFLAIIGHNGSGKTTLIKHMNGLLLPTQGDVIVDNLNTKNNDFIIKQKVGLVFQNPEDQLVNSIVEEDIAFGLENIGINSNEIQRKVKNILKKMGIYKLAKENVNNLSFGQKQIVALAGVLVMNPDYIILDEPMSCLDSINKSNLKRILKEINQQGKTIILVTNNLSDIEKLAKNVAILKNGEIIFYKKKEKLNKNILKKAELYE